MGKHYHVCSAGAETLDLNIRAQLMNTSGRHHALTIQIWARDLAKDSDKATNYLLHVVKVFSFSLNHLNTPLYFGRIVPFRVSSFMNQFATITFDRVTRVDVFFGVTALSLAILFFLRRKKGLPLPPGPKPLPLIGNLLDVPRNKPAWLVYEQWGKKYGKVVVSLHECLTLMIGKATSCRSK